MDDFKVQLHQVLQVFTVCNVRAAGWPFVLYRSFHAMLNHSKVYDTFCHSVQF